MENSKAKINWNIEYHKKKSQKTAQTKLMYGQGEEDMVTHRRNNLRYGPDIRQMEDQARKI